MLALENAETIAWFNTLPFVSVPAVDTDDTGSLDCVSLCLPNDSRRSPTPGNVDRRLVFALMAGLLHPLVRRTQVSRGDGGALRRFKAVLRRRAIEATNRRQATPRDHTDRPGRCGT